MSICLQHQWFAMRIDVLLVDLRLLSHVTDGVRRRSIVEDDRPDSLCNRAAACCQNDGALYVLAMGLLALQPPFSAQRTEAGPAASEPPI